VIRATDVVTGAVIERTIELTVGAALRGRPWF